MGEKDSRVGERQTASMRIKLKYPDVDTFIQKYAVNISRGGIFIATKQPKPVGTFVRFEFLLSDSEQSSIIRGEGQVQWTKEYDPNQPGKAHGMGVKFFRLDGASQTLIDRALKWRAEHGTSPRTELPAPAPVSSAQSIETSSSAHSIAAPSSAHSNTASSSRSNVASSSAHSIAAPSSARSIAAPSSAHSIAAPSSAHSNTASSSRSNVASSSAHSIAAPVEPAPAPSPESPPEPLAQPTAPIQLEETRAGDARREDTRPITIDHGDDHSAPTHGRSPHELTRPITMPEAEAAIAAERRGTEDLDALAAEWGLDHGKLTRTLKRMRPRLAEATAELERLLLKPPKPPLPHKGEALASLRQLLAKKRGSNGTPQTD